MEKESSNKCAFITGITGQDGSYLAEILLQKGYIVHGLVRKSSGSNIHRIHDLYSNPDNYKKRLFLHYGDMCDSTNMNVLLKKIKPYEIYNLAAQSHVQTSFEIPEYTVDTNGVGTLRLLNAIKETNQLKTRFYQASTSELFGKATQVPQSENTRFYPRSPYASAKLYAYSIVVNYREAYGLHASNGIMFNHESPRRDQTFITRKITLGAAKIKKGLQKCLYVGNLNAKRDWGYAPEYVEAMWRILQQDKPDDYVIATGETHTVREFIEETFAYLDMPIKWVGEGLSEKGVLPGRQSSESEGSGKTVVRVDPQYFRPSEVDLLIGDYTKAKKRLGWKPAVTFKQLVQIMAKADWELIKDSSKNELV